MPLAILVTLTCLLATGAAAAAAPSPASKAKRAVRAELIDRGLGRVRAVRCKRRSEHFDCRWRTERRLSPHRARICRGLHRVSVRGGAVRPRPRGRRRCRLRIRAVDPELGFNDNSVRGGQASAEQAAELTETVGAGIHRLTFDWRFVEAQRDSYRWADYDRIYWAMRARGIRPLLILMYAPSWAWDALSSCNSELSCRFPPAREQLAEWREIAALLATRYPEAAGIEVWNEPNETDFWRPAPDAARYTELLRQAHTAVKAANPRMPVVTGGFSNRALNTVDGRVGMDEFIQGVYAAGGRGHFDALAIHAYPGSIAFENYDRTLGEARLVKAQHGDAGVPIWVTETGFSTTGSDPVLRLTETEQAVATAEVYRRLKREPDVDAIIFHTLITPLGSAVGREPGFGLVRTDGRPKPAYCALTEVVRRVDPCP